MNSKILYERISRLREERNLTIYKLAQLSGVSEATLYSWRDRGTMPSLVILDALSEALGVSIIQVLTDDTETYKLNDGQKEILAKMAMLTKQQQQHILALIDSIGNPKK